jgi:Protein of unknown function (DUF3341)
MTVLIEFDNAIDAKLAVRRLLGLGYLSLDTYTPFPISEEGAHAPRSSPPLAVLAFAAGAAALAAAYVVQWYANVASYPLNIGGRPAHAAAAFVPSTFETICLFATIALFGGFLLLERLPRLWQPVFDIEGFDRASVDRFWIRLEIADSERGLERLIDDVLPIHPLRVMAGED